MTIKKQLARYVITSCLTFVLTITSFAFKGDLLFIAKSIAMLLFVLIFIRTIGTSCQMLSDDEYTSVNGVSLKMIVSIIAVISFFLAVLNVVAGFM